MDEFSTTKEIMLEFAQKIKKERLDQNITQEDMASKSGISLSTYKIFEKSGKGTFENFINILKALGKVSMLDSIFDQNSFSPKQMVLSKVKEKTRQRASSQKDTIKEIETNTANTRLGVFLDRLKAKNENK